MLSLALQTIYFDSLFALRFHLDPTNCYKIFTSKPDNYCNDPSCFMDYETTRGGGLAMPLPGNAFSCHAD